MGKKPSSTHQNASAIPRYAEYIDLAIIVMSVIVWLLCWALFIQFEFGLVFFSISLIAFIFLSLGKRRSSRELSAYSVFNPDCRRLPGTLTGEHVDKGIKLQI